jgi:hypothetical protein
LKPGGGSQQRHGAMRTPAPTCAASCNFKQLPGKLLASRPTKVVNERKEGVMSLSRRCVETLLDLVDNKLTSIQVCDRDDAREVQILECCKKELQALAETPRQGSDVMSFAKRQAMRSEPRLSA